MLRSCALCVLFACARPAVQSPRLDAGSDVERTIQDGERHRYSVELGAGGVLLAEVDQLGADVRITTRGPGGTVQRTYDTILSGKGTEHVRIDATKPGTYEVEVFTYPGQRGSYRARTIEIVDAKELWARDVKERAAVEKFFAAQPELVDEL